MSVPAREIRETRDTREAREAVRIKAKKYEGKQPPEMQKFSVDPQITSLEVLQSILIKAFNLKADFALSYRTVDDYGSEDYSGLFSDWDLDAAFLKAQNASAMRGAEPCVQLRVDVKPFTVVSDTWEEGGCKYYQSDYLNTVGTQKRQNDAPESKQTGLQGLFMNQMEKTFSIVSRALNLSEDPDVPIRPPLSDTEFRSYLDPVGQIVHSAKLKEVIYLGGIDPSLRRVVWKHILNVYPDGMSGKERMDYIKRKSAEYYSLREVWRDCLQKGLISSDLNYVTNMVKKDVLRTDRHHKFYAGSDDNKNIASLFNILTTYALNHPLVSYCQGMSDLASPLLVTMGDEAHAYVCLCALMRRLHPNFLLDGEAMTVKFAHLTEALQVYDPQFYAYLKSHQADDLLFCYRWLLLEMKREFAFEDSLRMLEVLWSSLPASPPNTELPLVEKIFTPCSDSEIIDEPPISPLVKTPRENAYTKMCAIRRQHSALSLMAAAKSQINSSYKRMNFSLDENIGSKKLNPSLQSSKEFQSLDDAALLLNSDLPAAKAHSPDEKPSTSEHPKASTNPFLTNYNSTNPFLTNDSMKSGDEFGSTSSLTRNRDSYDSPKSPSLSSRYQRSALNRFSLKHKFLSSLEKLDSVINSVQENDTKKIVKNLDEFKKFSSYTKSKTSVERKDSNAEKSYPVDTSPVDSPKAIKDSDNDDSSPDDSKEYSPMTTSITNELNIELEHLNRRVMGFPSTAQSEDTNLINEYEETCLSSSESNSVPPIVQNGHKNGNSILSKIDLESLKSNQDEVYIWENPLHGKISSLDAKDPITIEEFIKNIKEKTENKAELSTANTPQENKENESILKNISRETIKTNSKFFSNMSQELENAKRNCEILLSNKKPTNLQSIAATITNFQKKYDLHSQGSISNSDYVCEEVSEANTSKTLPTYLPPPQVFGGGNPFLMFLCLTVLMQHRDFIMRNQMDYNELAMHFDKMVRKHNVNRVLNQARRMYTQYLKHQNEKPFT